MKIIDKVGEDAWKVFREADPEVANEAESWYGRIVEGVKTGKYSSVYQAAEQTWQSLKYDVTILVELLEFTDIGDGISQWYETSYMANCSETACDPHEQY